MDKDIDKIPKNADTDIIIRIDDFGGKRGVTIREFVRGERYTGFTKAGTRIPVDKFKAFRDAINSISEKDLIEGLENLGAGSMAGAGASGASGNSSLINKGGAGVAGVEGINGAVSLAGGGVGGTVGGVKMDKGFKGKGVKSAKSGVKEVKEIKEVSDDFGEIGEGEI